MSDSEDQDSKTLDASEQKLRKAKEKGDVPISKEVGHLMCYIALIFSITLVLRSDLPVLADALGVFFHAPEMAVVGEGMDGAGDLIAATLAPLRAAGLFFCKIMGILFAAAMISGFLQGPFVVSAARIAPKPSKLNPLKGLAKIFGKDNLVEFFKNSVKLLMIALIAFWFIESRLEQMLPNGIIYPLGVLRILSSDTPVILMAICAFAVPIAVFDNIWKRLSFAKKQRMSHQDLRDEHKQSEGDPQLKARRMQLARQRMGRPLRQAVPEATLIITNPTHYAVALRYQRGVDQAPVCVAKGTDRIAAIIRGIAAEHEIIILENRPLARALYASAELDRTIPDEHWPLVADLVGYVMSLKNRVRRAPPPDTVLRSD